MTGLSISQEQQLLADSVRRFVERGYGTASLGASIAHPDGCLAGTWRSFGELGWLALPLPEQDGGMGGSVVDLCLVAQELGRGAVNEPFVACGVLAIGLLADQARDSVKSVWLPALLDGSRRIALASGEGLKANGSLVSGEAALVIGGLGVDGYLLAAETRPGAAALFMAPAAAPGLVAQARTLYDGQGAAQLRLDQVDAGEPIWQGPAAGLQQSLQRILQRAVVAHCAETSGAMQMAYQLTLDYLKTRRQFGRAITSNQVVQHRLVDLLVEIEEARSLTLAAAAVLDDAGASGAAAERYTAAAKACTAHAARLVWKEAVQLHGAIGMTQEYALGQYVKRLAAASVLYGSEEAHLERLAAISLD